MADTMTKKQRSAHMAKIKSKRTKPEMMVHGVLKGRRIRHKMWPDVHGRPDILVYGKGGGKDVLVFVNGCFWHGCRRHWKCPSTNSEFWQEKIDRNRKRQRGVCRKLRREGYEVAIVWEHDIVKRRIAL